MGKIVGLDGEPLSVDQATLTEEIAAPTLTGVRRPWSHSVADNITPERMASILHSSMDNYDPRDYLTLADEMEERETQYYSVLGTRKLAVESIDVTVEAVSDSAADVAMADEVRALLALDCVEPIRADLLDGLGKGFSNTEIVWDTSARQWQPKCIHHRDPTWFLFDQVDRRTLRLRDESDPLGLPLAPYKWISHVPRLRTGIPVRSGLARVVAFSWLCKAYALKNWMAFAEVFGMPIRVGKYPGTATSKDIAILRRAVANIGSDAAAVIPQSMVIEFQQAGNVSGGADLYDRLCERLDKQISKAVVGQTMTADDGSSRAQATVHNEVRGDIRDADGKQLAATLRRDLVIPYIVLNHGPQKAYPKITIKLPQREDIAGLTDAVAKLVPLGLRVGQSPLRDKLGIPDPDPKEEMLGVPAAAPNPMPTAQDRQRASNAPMLQQPGAPDIVDGQVEQLAGQADPVVADFLGRVQQLLAEVQSLDEFRDRLIELYPQFSVQQFGAAMQLGMAAAQLAGRFDVMQP